MSYALFGLGFLAGSLFTGVTAARIVLRARGAECERDEAREQLQASAADARLGLAVRELLGTGPGCLNVNQSTGAHATRRPGHEHGLGRDGVGAVLDLYDRTRRAASAE